jgi:phage tail-like protein
LAVANPAFENVDPPFTTFRFEVTLDITPPLPGVPNPVCNAAFAEVDGLEMSMEPKAIHQGGDNTRHIHLPSAISYSQLTLKRGMTADLSLWNWFALAGQLNRAVKANGKVTIWDANGTPRITFVLTGCLPVKMRAPSLNAKDGLVAIEEMQLVYDKLEVRAPGQSGGMGLDFNAGVSVGAGIGAGFDASASFGASVSGGPGLSGGISASASAGFSLG